MQEELEEYAWQENLEKEELTMEMKKNNEYYSYAGFCDDWDAETHEAQYDPTCGICHIAFEDG